MPDQAKNIRVAFKDGEVLEYQKAAISQGSTQAFITAEDVGGTVMRTVIQMDSVKYIFSVPCQ